MVLNLIITGIPSIRKNVEKLILSAFRFKPYYNWNTFNTRIEKVMKEIVPEVLNLIITGIPSIQDIMSLSLQCKLTVLNLIITGIPSILTRPLCSLPAAAGVLNLIITGIPSILCIIVFHFRPSFSFKPYYNWNTFNTFLHYLNPPLYTS